MRLALDMAGIHAVLVRHGGEGAIELTLDHASGDRRSLAHDALARQLRVLASGVLHRFDDATRRVVLSNTPTIEVLVMADAAPPLSIATLDVGPGSFVERAGASRYLLSPFELRYAADTGAIHPVRPAARRSAGIPLPRTDLHTHFAGCVRGDDLVRMGAEQHVVYPRALLEDAKIRVDGDVRLAELAPLLRQRLADKLGVPLDRRVTFLEMERVYRLRSPLTKARSMRAPLCRRIAADYAGMGVDYVELSVGDVVQADFLRAVHAEVPRIEAETGVTMRFLVAISRHDDPEWDLDLVERIKALAGSVYIAGVDFMGHETNSTRAFAPILRAIGAFADEARPGFVVRVHAGESPAHPENVRVALEEMRGHDVRLRIGHGLFGVDDSTLAEIVRSGAIVEFNLDSNVALNHLQSARAVPIRRYVEAGARVVLGSDGYGIYQTSPAAAARAALVAGLDLAHLETIAETEREYIERAHELDAERARAASSFVVADDAPPVHFTEAIIERRRSATAARDAAIEARLREVSVPVLAASDIAALRASADIMLVSIAGAWTRSFESLTEAARETIAREMEALIEGLDPRDVIFVTGGTRFGVEGLAGRSAARRGFMVIAALVRATPPSALAPDAMTHACFVGETLYDKAAGLYTLVSENAGVCIFVAGGQIVSDEIQTARNLRLRYLLMDGVGGASARHAAEHPARAFRRGAEALHALRAFKATASEHVPHWFEGPNPTVDAVVVRTRDGIREILLVLRDLDAPAEPGKWALPGGFVASASPRGERWTPAEADRDALVRELAEETGLVIDPSRPVEVGVHEGGGRDPRDTPRSWSRSTSFLVELDGAETTSAIAGGDDAADAAWFAVDRLPPNLAFDHERIIEQAIRRRT